MTAHRGIQGPAAAQGTDGQKRKAFLRAFSELSTRINLFMSLPIDMLGRLVLKKKPEEIGRAAAEVPVS